MENSNDKNNFESTLLTNKHLFYLLNLDKTKDSDAIGYYSNEYLKMAAF